MKALVTGAGGFVGQYLVEHLLECGDEVVGADLRAGSRQIDLGRGSFEFQELNVCDAEACGRIITEVKPEVIYHLAAVSFVPEAENNFDRALQANVAGTNNIARICYLLQLGTTIVYVSSAEVYGRVAPGDLPIDERVPLNPANNYSLSKAMAEMVLQRYAQFGYVRAVVMRPFNHIGPGQDSRFVVSNFAHQLAQIAKGQVAPVLRVGNLEAQRDFSDVRDIVKAYRLAALKGSGVYNLCSGQAVSIRSVLDRLIAASGLKVEIERDSSRMRVFELSVLYGSYEKARKELGWAPGVPLDQSLAEIYKSCLEQQRSEAAQIRRG
jgi:GDP-4-dehydro-6-deoxy-D-mannose reductase